MKEYKYRKWFTIDGKRYSVYSDSLEEIPLKMAQKIAQVKTERPTVSGDMTLSRWAEKCIATYKTNQNERTRQTYTARVRHCILAEIGGLRLKEIKPIHLQECINRQTGKSKTQINEVFYAIKFLFRHAYENHLIKDNPAEQLIKPKPAQTEPRRALTPYERQTILKVARTDRRYFLFLLMLECGCRPAEAAECMGKDIAEKSGVPMLHVRGTKTSAANRFVPIPPELYRLISDTPKMEYIAQNSNGNKLTVRRRDRIWKSFKRQLNIAMGCSMYRNELIPPYPLAPDLVPYCLRHEYCTELARRGVDIRTAQKLMGHSDIKLTANIYTNLDDADIVETARLLNYDAGSKSSNG